MKNDCGPTSTSKALQQALFSTRSMESCLGGILFTRGWLDPWGALLAFQYFIDDHQGWWMSVSTWKSMHGLNYLLELVHFRFYCNLSCRESLVSLRLSACRFWGTFGSLMAEIFCATLFLCLTVNCLRISPLVCTALHFCILLTMSCGLSGLCTPNRKKVSDFWKRSCRRS